MGISGLLAGLRNAVSVEPEEGGLQTQRAWRAESRMLLKPSKIEEGLILRKIILNIYNRNKT